MTEDEPLITPSGDFKVWGWLSLLIVFIFAFYEVFYLGFVCTDRYFQLSDGHMAVAIFLSLTLWLWYMSRGGYTTTLYADRIEEHYRGALHRTVYLSEVRGWDATYNDEDHLSTIVLTLHDSSTFTIVDQRQAYFDFFTEQGFERIPNKEPVTIREVMSVIAVIVLIMGTAAAFLALPTWLRDRQKGDALHTFTIITAHWPEFSKGGDGDPPTVNITARGLEEFAFTTDDSDVSYRYPRLAHYAHGLDTLHLTISRYDYDVKVAHTRPSTWLDRHVGWHEIPIVRVDRD